MKIAFLGPEGSNSHLAAQKFLKTEATDKKSFSDWDECVPFRNFPEVLAAGSHSLFQGINPGVEPKSLESPALVGRFFTTSTTWEPQTLKCLKLNKNCRL